MSCKPTYKGKRYNSLEELYRANGINEQQKQQVQQIYSQYLDSLNKPDTNPILQNNQQEQVRKFAELQERLNNKEFLEGAKNAYESTPRLQQFGTQEEYNDYIARVSLGIIKNPSSGEYNYTSKVKDIVYHGGSPAEDFSSPEFGKSGFHGYFSTIKEVADEFANRWTRNKPTKGKVKALLLNITNPEITENLYQGEYLESVEYLKRKISEGKNDGVIAKNTNDKFSDKLGSYDQYIAFKTEQIHILGSKQDIEGLKNFINQQNKIYKVYNKPRDLKPSSLKFTLATGEKRNQYDLDSVKLLFKLNAVLDGDFTEDTSFIMLENFSKYVLPQSDFKSALKDEEQKETYVKLLRNFLGKWTNISLNLLKDKKSLIPTNEFTNYGEYFNGVSLLDNYADIKNLLTNTEDVIDYTLGKAEIIMGDLNQSKFNRELSDSMVTMMAEKENFFAKKLINLYDEDDTKADIKILLSNHDNPIYIKFVDKKSLPGIDNSINIKAKKDLTDEGVVTSFVRYNDNGDILYTLPPNARVVKKDEKEIIYIEAVDVERGRITGFSKNFHTDKNNLFKSFKGNLKAFVPLMNGDFGTRQVIIKKGEESIVKTLNNYIMESFSKYTNFVPKDPSELYSASWYSSNIPSIIKQLSLKKYASWEKSRELIAARIPAQSTQSFMEMKQIGYLNSKSNDAYVSLLQIWLQGSDFDIDKAYILSSGFNAAGHIDLWTNSLNYSSLEQLNELVKFPIPSGKTVKFKKDGIDITEEFSIFSDYINSLEQKTSALAALDQGKFLSLADIFTILDNNLALDLPTELPAHVLQALNSAIRKVNLNKGITLQRKFTKGVSGKMIAIDGLSEEAEIFVKLINSHNTYEGYASSRHAINNAVVSRIKQVISDPTTQIWANAPVEVQMWHDAIKKILKKKGKETDAEILSPYDLFSMYKQQYDASVGKDDVGIAANGLKVFFALSSYYNNYFQNNFETTSEALRRSSKTFMKEFKILDANNNLVTYKPSAVSDVYMTKSQRELLSNILVGAEVYNTEAALALSAFTSAATDNAKELIMAKVNANSQLASMHIYLMILGFTPEQVVEIMTSDIIEEVINRLEVNMLYPGAKENSIAVIFDSILKEYDPEDPNYISAKSLKDIYSAAQEIKTLAKILGVNQKTSANTEELYNYLSTFDTAVLSRENDIFGKTLSDIRVWEEYYDSEDPIKKQRAEDILARMVKTLISRNPQLNNTLDEEYVRSILKAASHVPVKYITEDGQIKEKVVSLLGGQFDYRYFMLENNNEYRRLTKQYYNLIKNTFNIFDIIDEVPHFKQMIQSINLAHNILSASSVKYNSVHTVLRDTLRDSWHRLDFEAQDNIKNYMGNKAFMPQIKDQNINKFILGIDMRLKAKWLHSDTTSHLTFNVNKLLQQVNELLPEDEQIPSVTLYNSDEAWKFTDKELVNSKWVTTVYADNSKNDKEFIVTLSTNYGIANFKKLMEEVLLPIVKTKSTTIAESLRIRTVNNLLGLRGNSIESSFSLSDISNPSSLLLTKKLLKSFNDLDLIADPKNTVKNSQNKVLKWRDLFFVYNLLVNNEKYGDLRLTPLFQDYLKETNSLGFSYVTYAANLDNHSLRLFNLEEELINHPLYDSTMSEEERDALKDKIKKGIENDILFYAFNDRGTLYIWDSNKNRKVLSVQNPNFVVITSINESDEIKRQWLDLYEIKRLIKSNGFIVKFEC